MRCEWEGQKEKMTDISVPGNRAWEWSSGPNLQAFLHSWNYLCRKKKCHKHQYSVRCHLDLCVRYIGYRTYLGTVWRCGCWGSTAHTGYRVYWVQVWGQLVCPDHLLSHGTSGGSCIQYRPWPENDNNKPKDTSGRRRMKRCRNTRGWNSQNRCGRWRLKVSQWWLKH